MHSKGSTINQLGGRGADFRERICFFFGNPTNEILIFLPKLTEDIFFNPIPFFKDPRRTNMLIIFQSVLLRC